MEEGTKILIIDDKEGMPNLFRFVLEPKNYDILTATTGEEAVSMARDDNFDLVITDIKLPGEDSLSVLEELRSIDEDIMIVIMTAYASLDTAMKAIRHGAYDYITKPFDNIDEVVNVIDKAVEKRKLILSNKELLESLQRANRELEILNNITKAMISTLNLDQILQIILNGATNSLGFDRAILMLVDEERQVALGRMVTISDRYRGNFSSPELNKMQEKVVNLACPLRSEKHSIVIRAAMEGRVYHLSDALKSDLFQYPQIIKDMGIESFAVVPMIDEDKIVGLLMVDNSYSEEEITEETIKKLLTFANQAGLAIENARLHEQMKKRVRELTALHEASQSMVYVLDATHLFKLVLDEAIHMTQAERGSFMTVEEGTDKLVIKVARGINSDVIEGLRIKMGNSIVDQVIRSGKHLLVTNVEGDPVIGRTNINSRYRTSSFLSVPMLKEGKVVGVLNLADKMGGESFDPDDLRVVTTLISQASISLERVELYNDLEKLSVTDGLTGLYNHRYFQERLGEEIIRGGQYHYPVSLIIFDIDHFKRYNDTYGHPMGDEALKKIADILRSTTRKTDIPARYGGEEIAVILPKTDKEKAITVAERMRKAVSKCDFVQDDGTPTRKITLSAGVASYPQDADIKKELVGLADKALYAAKDKGRNRVCY